MATGLEPPVVFHEPIPFGVDENGEQVAVSLVERSVLICWRQGYARSPARPICLCTSS